MVAQQRHELVSTGTPDPLTFSSIDPGSHFPALPLSSAPGACRGGYMNVRKEGAGICQGNLKQLQQLPFASSFLMMNWIWPPKSTYKRNKKKRVRSIWETRSSEKYVDVHRSK